MRRVRKSQAGIEQTEGREVITWTVDSFATFMRLAAYGVDGVITNDPDTLTRPAL